MRILRLLYNVASSVRLFLGIVVVLVVLSVLATVVPQGYPPGWYADRFGYLPGTFLQLLGITDFFSSLHLLVLVGLMELNLVLCTVPRMVRRLVRRTHPLWSYGPDVIHLGLIVAVAGGLVTMIRSEEQAHLVPTGAAIALGPDTAPVRVVDSREIRDDRGTVVDWVINLEHQGDTIELAINDPVTIAGFRFHFFHWGEEPTIVLAGPDGTERPLLIGEGLQRSDGETFVFVGFDVPAEGASTSHPARFDRLAPDGSLLGTLLLSPGESIGGFRYVASGTEVLNGFTVRRDPGRPLVLAGLIGIVLGMALYTGKLWRSYG
ncbi:MAG: cytochrome c biogenesis protein ResB [Alkalispirochaeta sp.]